MAQEQSAGAPNASWAEAGLARHEGERRRAGQIIITRGNGFAWGAGWVGVESRQKAFALMGVFAQVEGRMIPFQTLAQVRTPDGSLVSLHEHDGEFFIKHNGRQLMSTTSTSSELLLADLGCRHLGEHVKPRILIGGLGLGYTLKRVLEIVGPTATVHVSELLPEVVSWNREFLGGINAASLDDQRVEVLVQDVFEVIREGAKTRYDAILLDVDHTPDSLMQAKNVRLYDRHGFDTLMKAMRPNARVAYWSATEEPGFVRRLGQAGFEVETFEAKAHERAKRAMHRIYVGVRTSEVSIENRAPRARVEPTGSRRSSRR